MIKPDIYTNRAPNANENYAYQTLAVNMRGYKQNIRNGNNVMLMNTELRLPVFTTFIDKPINSAFLRNFQLISFIDIGTAWNGETEVQRRELYGIRNRRRCGDPHQGRLPRALRRRLGFGARTTVLGYFARFDGRLAHDRVLPRQTAAHLRLGVDF
ncbi:hypothetical protein [Chitinophaga caseinilytica]|uniref:hypothetical protein n=1 Tax=Chitinophaga caseinilytica TaxID=2267521 RepID=UPI003C2E810C